MCGAFQPEAPHQRVHDIGRRARSMRRLAHSKGLRDLLCVSDGRPGGDREFCFRGPSHSVHGPRFAIMATRENEHVNGTPVRGACGARRGCLLPPRAERCLCSGGRSSFPTVTAQIARRDVGWSTSGPQIPKRPFFRTFASPGESITGCLSASYDARASLGVHAQRHASIAVVSKISSPHGALVLSGAVATLVCMKLDNSTVEEGRSVNGDSWATIRGRRNGMV